MRIRILHPVFFAVAAFMMLEGCLYADNTKYEKNKYYSKTAELFQHPLAVQKREPIDVSKAFVKALIDEDRETVEKLLGYNEKNIYFIYSDASRRNMAKQHYKTMTKWEQKYHNSSYATVKAYGKNSGGFEVNKTNGIWYIRTFY